jgi:hypothetical protein
MRAAAPSSEESGGAERGGNGSDVVISSSPSLRISVADRAAAFRSGDTPDTPGRSGDTPDTPGRSGDTPDTPGRSGDTPNTPGRSGDIPDDTPGAGRGAALVGSDVALVAISAFIFSTASGVKMFVAASGSCERLCGWCRGGAGGAGVGFIVESSLGSATVMARSSGGAAISSKNDSSDTASVESWIGIGTETASCESALSASSDETVRSNSSPGAGAPEPSSFDKSVSRKPSGSSLGLGGFAEGDC